MAVRDSLKNSCHEDSRVGLPRARVPSVFCPRTLSAPSHRVLLRLAATSSGNPARSFSGGPFLRGPHPLESGRIYQTWPAIGIPSGAKCPVKTARKASLGQGLAESSQVPKTALSIPGCSPNSWRKDRRPLRANSPIPSARSAPPPPASHPNPARRSSWSLRSSRRHRPHGSECRSSPRNGRVQPPSCFDTANPA